jgi:hypothetical protein
MKGQFGKQRQNEASVLMIALVVATIIGITLGSYLMLVRSQNAMVSRSQSWNSALMMAEAGVEEALAQLNPEFSPGAYIDRSANGWGTPYEGMYGPKLRDLPTGTYGVFYTTNKHPIIYSIGYAPVPRMAGALSRAVRVVTTNVPLYSAAIVARGNINMNGNNIVTDSFDSGIAGLSNNGRYDPTRASTNGDVASLGGVINVNGGDIHGDLYLGPTADNTIRNNGSISGNVYTDFNADVSQVTLPYSTGWLPALSLPGGTNINGINYDYYFSTSGDYSISASTLSGNIYIEAGANVRLKILANTFSPDLIRVAAAGGVSGNLQIYMTGSTFTLSGHSVVDGGRAEHLSYYGLPANTTINFTGNASFTGTIYAPNANLKLGGGGSDNYDFVGACITRSVTMNGHFSFHFDEALLRDGPARGYAATSWREL